MIIENEALKIESPDFRFDYTIAALEVYKYLNQETFKDFSTSVLFKDTLDLIFKVHSQSPNIIYTENRKPIFCNKNNKVCLCYSGGLDSAYQAFALRNRGYDVTLLHCTNANVYSNFQETKVAKAFADKFNFKLVEVKFTPKYKTEYKKYWQENSFKNSLIYCIAIDYMLANDIYYLSGGDDLRLDIKNQVTGVNTGDSKEITLSFINSFNVAFIPVESNKNKAQRLKLLYDNDASDYYISCVGPGRLIKTRHDRYEEKFGVKLDKWSCCSCRKCCMHILQNKYLNNIEIPIELENRCWEKMAEGADEPFFGKNISLEDKIKNLAEY